MVNNEWQQFVRKSLVDDPSSKISSFVSDKMPDEYLMVRSRGVRYELQRLRYGDVLTKENLLQTASNGRLYRIVARKPLRLRTVQREYVRLLIANRQIAALMMLYRCLDPS